MENERPKFIPPAIQDNPNGWGPCSVPEKFKDMPYQPFSKGDRLGKISDWTGNTYQDRRYQHKYASAYGAGSQYAYFHDEDESSFQLVDTTKAQKPQYQRGRLKYNQLRQQRERRAALSASKMEVLSKSQKSRERDRQRQLRKWQKNYGRNMHDNRRQQQSKVREASVLVHPSWSIIEEMEFPRLAKLTMAMGEEPKELFVCGSLEYYDKTYDRVNSKTEKKLQVINRTLRPSVTTTDDPIIRMLSKSTGNVYATDAVITTLMCATRSVYPWDIVAQRVGDKLFFDKRDDPAQEMPTVSETAIEPPQDESNSINSPKNLSLEAAFINHNFSQQVLKMGDEKYEFDRPNPFSKDEEADPGSVAYRYRQFDLGNDIELVVRCEHDALVMGPNGEPQFMTVRAFNEWDSKCSGGVDWRTKIDNQRGAVLATELKNNSFKLARWASSALLAGSDTIKFGFVSRSHFKDSRKHTILGTQQFKPSEFAAQMNLKMDNAWGILRCIIDMCKKLDQGKYLIMKDPNKPVIRIYDIPDDTFDDEDDSGDDDDDEDDSDEDSEEEEAGGGAGRE